MDRSSLQYSAEDFYSLLSWLDSNQQRAAEKYEGIRRRLVQYFAWRHCSDPEELTDETMIRVARRVSEIRNTYQGEPAYYFYGVARNVLHDNFKQRSSNSSRDQELPISAPGSDENREHLYECFDKCMLALPAEKRELLTAYYEHSKQAKIDARRQLAAQLGVNSEALRVRLFRITSTLRECVESCMKSPQP